MGKESVVEIPPGSGNRYRYAYDPDTQKMRYMGPVGESPPIDEVTFQEGFADPLVDYSDSDETVVFFIATDKLGKKWVLESFRWPIPNVWGEWEKKMMDEEKLEIYHEDGLDINKIEVQWATFEFKGAKKPYELDIDLSMFGDVEPGGY